ncbi:MAG: endolytic transglycosylase MltG [Peptoniphilus sp.]|nr:endolytic transglycosylase MltG [Peptoniphilus sp.]MDD7363642.1 endolytic transglycosylase MltG [Bacillota bacterium]MDY6044712.1 endolytic transglycosylase MltG [Peptoniphilus sp.]
MNFNGRFPNMLVKLLRFVAIVLVILVLLFIVKWRMNHLFSMMTPEEKKDTSITEEIKSSKDQIDKISNVAKDASKESTLLKIETADVAQVAEQLKKEGLIRDTDAFIKMATQSGLADYITPGSYEIPEGTSPETILKKLSETGLQKATRTVHIEIPEHANDEMIASIVAKEDLVQDEYTFLQMIREQSAVPKIKPGGYQIHAPLPAQDLLDILTQYNTNQPGDPAPAEQPQQEQPQQ